MRRYGLFVGIDKYKNGISRLHCAVNDARELSYAFNRTGYSVKLLTNEECANAIDMGNFYRVPSDKRGLNYDKYFSQGDADRNTLTEFNSNNTKLLDVEETKAKIASLKYIQDELAKME